VSVHHLDRLFEPRSIAVIGASDTQPGVGHSVLRNLRECGFEGAIYPVNPHRQTIQGLRAYPAIGDLPQTPDLAVVCTPAATVPGLVEECGAAGVGGMVVLSAGFRERGEEGQKLEQALQVARQRFRSMRILGPNCLGYLAPHRRLNASFATHLPAPGNVAFVSQSGALCTAILDWARQEEIGFSHFISVGNMADVTFADVIDFLALDPHTCSIVLYIESIPDAPAFLSAARAFTRTKPIVVYKAGRFAESAQAAATHTGALAGEDAVYDAAFERAGIVRVDELHDLFDTAELLARRDVPRGSRLAVVTNAGGPGVIAADSLIGRGGELARLSDDTRTALDRILPPYWSHANPIDLLGDATPQRYAAAIEPILLDPGVDAVLVILTPQAMTDPATVAGTVGEIAGRANKPVLATWMGGTDVAAGIRALNAARVPTFSTPEQAVKAFLMLVQYGRRRELLYETPREIPLRVSPEEVEPTIAGRTTRDARRKPIAHLIQRASRSHSRVLSEEGAKDLLRHYGIPIVETMLASSAQAAVRVAEELGYPVVLKIASPQITHKTEVGGVELNLQSAVAVEQAYERIVSSARERAPAATIDGVTVQRMVAPRDAVELILGSKHDATFGAVILLGAGGIATEVYRDRTIALPPLNERLAEHMLRSLRSWPLLDGYRGRRPVDRERLIETIVRFSWLVADCPEIVEFDINPLLVSPEGTIALDARAMLREARDSEEASRPHVHLAIQPYPEYFTRQIRLTSGEEVLLRPIRHEDEPLWREMLTSCSAESIRTRFAGLIRGDAHDVAARFCCIDYDREMAVVAESRRDGRPCLMGVARLVADADHETAEFAILVADPWQGQGLGGQLMQYCLEIAEAWGLSEITAQTGVDNPRMLRMLNAFGFERVGVGNHLIDFRRSL
jgi:acetyltransferase